MKRASANYRLLIVILAMGLLVASIWNLRTSRQAKTEPSAAEAIASFPTPKGQTASDREIAKWTEAARKSPDKPTMWVNLGDALMQKGRETFDASYYGLAEKAYRQAIRLDPKNADANLGMAWVNGGRHEFEASIDWARKALESDPRSAPAYGLLGDAAVEMGDYELAFQHYQKMLDIRPDASSYSRGAHLLHLTGDVLRSSLIMQKAINAGSGYAENVAWCRAQLALIYFSNGNLLAAEATLEQALKQSPNNYHVLAAMGRVKSARKDFKTAIDYYHRAVAIAPQHEALIALGDLYLLTGNPAEAEKQFSLLESIHKINKANGVKGDAQMAMFYADHDRNLKEALTMAETEFKTRKNVTVADTLAWCLYKNGKYNEAKQAIRSALSHKTPEAAYLFHAGMIYSKLNQPETAKQYLSRALSLNPGWNPAVSQAAVEMLAQLGGKATEGKRIAGR